MVDTGTNQSVTISKANNGANLKLPPDLEAVLKPRVKYFYSSILAQNQNIFLKNLSFNTASLFGGEIKSKDNSGFSHIMGQYVTIECFYQDSAQLIVIAL
ncbi:MAG: hypothetical protein HYV28_09410 [Ignavibacteriales bacterium]|nr:hypothetical protein [Ignavibacteriales bacterium]